MSIASAALIAAGAGLSAAAGASMPGLVFVGVAGLLLAGIALRLLGRRGFTPPASGGHRRSGPALLLAALGAVLLVPAVYTAGLAYGSAWSEWAPVHSSNVYVERPGGFIVLLATLVVCAALLLFAAMAALLAATRSVTQRRHRTPAL